MHSKDPFAPRPVATDKPQLTREEIKNMHHLDVVQAVKEGRCQEAMTTPNPDYDGAVAGSARQGKDWQAIVEARKNA